MTHTKAPWEVCEKRTIQYDFPVLDEDFKPTTEIRKEEVVEIVQGDDWDPESEQQPNDGKIIARCFGPDAEANGKLFSVSPDMLVFVQDVEKFLSTDPTNEKLQGWFIEAAKLLQQKATL